MKKIPGQVVDFIKKEKLTTGLVASGVVGLFIPVVIVKVAAGALITAGAIRIATVFKKK